MTQDEISALRRIIASSEKIVFFGGAGVSVESGIPDFRSAGGLYNQKGTASVPPETILSHSYFTAHTKEFFDYYRAHMIYPSARPNAAHIALANLEAEGKLSAVVTQNIDGLHQAAGSKRVFELHGSVLRNHCVDCGQAYAVDFILQSAGVPRCMKCGGIVKPDVVLYEEPLDKYVWLGAAEAVSEAELLIIGGTSLAVWPAASIVDYASGARVVIINLSDTPKDLRADLVIRRPVGEVFSSL